VRPSGGVGSDEGDGSGWSELEANVGSGGGVVTGGVTDREGTIGGQNSLEHSSAVAGESGGTNDGGVGSTNSVGVSTKELDERLDQDLSVGGSAGSGSGISNAVGEGEVDGFDVVGRLIEVDGGGSRSSVSSGGLLVVQESDGLTEPTEFPHEVPNLGTASSESGGNSGVDVDVSKSGGFPSIRSTSSVSGVLATVTGNSLDSVGVLGEAIWDLGLEGFEVSNELVRFVHRESLELNSGGAGSFSGSVSTIKSGRSAGGTSDGGGVGQSGDLGPDTSESGAL